MLIALLLSTVAGKFCFTASNSAAATRPSVLRDANNSRRDKIGALTAGLQKASEWLDNSAPVAQVAASNSYRQQINKAITTTKEK